MVRNALLLATLPILILGCRSKDMSQETGVVDHTGTETVAETGTETGAETGRDTSGPAPENATEGLAFCSGGGVVSGGGFSGVSCTAPLDVATRFASNDAYTWQPGPITFIAPAGGLQ